MMAGKHNREREVIYKICTFGGRQGKIAYIKPPPWPRTYPKAAGSDSGLTSRAQMSLCQLLLCLLA
jgi:hypothetical protein